MENSEKKHISRRKFINTASRLGLGLVVGGIAGKLLYNAVSHDTVWQLDPSKCVHCEQCATHCVLTPSAVKCVHVYNMCGYCDLCGGYFKPEAKELTTGAENQLCPTGAIKRTYVEEPFFEYVIDEELCIGCALCVAGCHAFGNGSLQLQVVHNICVNCNQCAIALACPSDAFRQVPANEPSIFKGFSGD